MRAGRELDALVAEKVMGVTVEKDKFTKLFDEPKESDPTEFFVGKSNDRIPKYSTDIAAAWEVLEKLWAIPYRKFHTIEVSRDICLNWVCRIAKEPGPGEPLVFEFADTAPEAICLAALKAVAL